MRVRSLLLLALLAGTAVIGVACSVDVELPFGGGTPTPTLPPCGPTVPVESDIRYVAEFGSDSNAGTSDAPFRTISQALVAPPLASGITAVFVQGGEYPDETLIISAPHTNTRIYGAFNGNWSKRDEVNFATTLYGGNFGLPIVGGNGSPIEAHLDGLVLVAGTSNATSGSSYGLHLRFADVTLDCVEVRAGNGQNGANGLSAFAGFFPVEDPPPTPTPPGGSFGGVGGEGCPTAPGFIGEGGAGGDGSIGGASAEPGLPGDGGAGSLGGGAGLLGMNGGVGLPGANGLSGSGGVGGAATGTASALGWTGGVAGAGEHGSYGRGGGGGGGSGGSGSDGSGGGGGGGGGCRGIGGAGAEAGGGSIAIYLWGSTVTGVDVLLTTGKAGNGGRGSTGSNGGLGADGSPGASTGLMPGMTGGTGGNGGMGGAGGGGGGGAGGMSVGVFVGDGSEIIDPADFLYVLGSAGRPGPGGTSPAVEIFSAGKDGAPGIQSPRYP